jgi:hypothetical protein
MNTEKRLQKIEEQLEAIRKQIREMELNDPCGGWDEFCMYMKPVWNKQAKLDREKRMLMTPEFERDIPNYGDVMSLKEFINCVEEGGFIDYDGFGTYVRDGKVSNIDIHPSDVKHKAIRKDFDTVIWFNK